MPWFFHTFQKQPPVPLYMGFNMWHVNNPDDIVNGSTPSFTEIGPFIYREVREKRNIETSADGCSINAAQYKRYDFDMEKTQELCTPKELCGDARSTHVTIVNAAYVGMLQLIKDGFRKYWTR